VFSEAQTEWEFAGYHLKFLALGTDTLRALAR
jgi:hypothetical protein